MLELQLSTVLKVLPSACAEDTTQSYWNPTRPVTGHCALASIFIKDIWGGTIARALMSNNVTHYWNVLPSGAWVDATRSQFDDDVWPTYVIADCPRKVYWFGDTEEKWELFRPRLYRVYYDAMTAVRPL